MLASLEWRVMKVLEALKNEIEKEEEEKREQNRPLFLLPVVVLRCLLYHSQYYIAHILQHWIAHEPTEVHSRKREEVFLLVKQLLLLLHSNLKRWYCISQCSKNYFDIWRFLVESKMSLKMLVSSCIYSHWRHANILLFSYGICYHSDSYQM